VALDDRYANKFAPLDSTTIYSKPDHKLLYTPMTGEMKCPTNIPLSCTFHSISSGVDATHAPTISQMIWSTSYHRVTLLVRRSWSHLLFTVAFVHRRQVLLKIHRHMVHRSEASNLSFTLVTGPQVKSCHDLLHLSHMTQCYVSYTMSSSITCVSLATNSSHLYRHGMCCSYKCTGGLITRVFHLNTY
jgi:hypothetical protein